MTDFRKRIIAEMIIMAGSRPYDPDIQGNIIGWNLYDREWEFTKLNRPDATGPTWRLKPKEESLVGTVSDLIEKDGKYFAIVNDKPYDISENVSFGMPGDREIHKIEKHPPFPDEEYETSEPQVAFGSIKMAEDKTRSDKEHLTVVKELTKIKDEVVKHTISDTDNPKTKEEAKKMATDFRKKIMAGIETEIRPMQYEQKFFAQGDEAVEYLDMIENRSPSALMVYLSSSGILDNTGEMSEKPHHGEGDQIRKLKGGWIVSWNSRIPYVGVELVHEGHNPNAWVSPEEAIHEEKMKEHNRILGGSMKSNFRKRIISRMKRRARVATEGERMIEDKQVVIGENSYSVDAVVSYSAEYEPETGDGWNEPREGGYFSVGIDVVSIKAFDDNGEEITNGELMSVIQAQFLRLYENKIEEQISEELEKEARDEHSEPDEPDYDYDDRF